MATIRELILQNLQATLQGITIANGYATNVRQVSRVPQAVQTEPQLPAIYLGQPAEDVTQVPLGLQTNLLHITLSIWMGQNFKDSESKIDALLGDVKRAILVDHTRAAHAVDTILRNSQTGTVEEAAFTWATLDIDVHYRHLYGDPSAQA